jgi:hypothetical protein
MAKHSKPPPEEISTTEILKLKNTIGRRVLTTG